ncbi:MAG: alpha/beta hydrolase, partial [Actinobacteria bacterium]|nr:alpha/beta hydrolase [Actinomycetota bacterium]
FSMLETYARYEGIHWNGRPTVRRVWVDIGGGQEVSALVWGEGEPDVAFLHGRGQNAHTWDSVGLYLDRSMIAFDLPGHGHSSWRPDHNYSSSANAAAVAAVLAQVAPGCRRIVGMSMGGATTINFAATRKELVDAAVIVDITPGSGPRVQKMTNEQRGGGQLAAGPRTFATFDEMLHTTAAALPGRDPESLRPGVRHNARQLADGTWAWRYDHDFASPPSAPELSATEGWDLVGEIACPVMLVRGGASFHVADEDVAEFLSRQPSARIETVDGAHHSVQSDRPGPLAALITDFFKL